MCPSSFRIATNVHYLGQLTADSPRHPLSFVMLLYACAVLDMWFQLQNYDQRTCILTSIEPIDLNIHIYIYTS
jgi:hypothetical protein